MAVGDGKDGRGRQRVTARSRGGGSGGGGGAAGVAAVRGEAEALASPRSCGRGGWGRRGQERHQWGRAAVRLSGRRGWAGGIAGQ